MKRLQLKIGKQIVNLAVKQLPATEDEIDEAIASQYPKYQGTPRNKIVVRKSFKG